MSGLPLNGQLTELGGRLESAGKTAPAYRFYALPGGPPHRPGMVRVAEGGGAIELEVWSLPADKVGAFAAPDSRAARPRHGRAWPMARPCWASSARAMPPRARKDITSLGGWRAYLKSLAV